jgi:hypothetical protein
MYFAAQTEYRIPELFEPMPRPGRRLLGIPHNILVELDDADLIKVVEVTRPSCRRPVKLVYIPSLIAYLERLEEIADNRRRAEIRAGYAHHHKPADLLEVVTE